MEYPGKPLTNSPRHIFASRESIGKNFALFMTSRRFYQELSSIFYSTGNFYVYIVPIGHPRCVRSLPRRLRFFELHYDHLRKLEINICLFELAQCFSNSRRITHFESNWDHVMKCPLAQCPQRFARIEEFLLHCREQADGIADFLARSPAKNKVLIRAGAVHEDVWASHCLVMSRHKLDSMIREPLRRIGVKRRFCCSWNARRGHAMWL